MTFDLSPLPTPQTSQPTDEAYVAAREAMKQREAVPGRPEQGPYPATLDEVAESITDAVWPLAYLAGRLAAASDTRTEAGA